MKNDLFQVILFFYYEIYLATLLLGLSSCRFSLKKEKIEENTFYFSFPGDSFTFTSPNIHQKVFKKSV